MSKDARRRYTAADKAAAVDLHNQLRADGVSSADAISATGVPKATLLRWVAEAEIEQVEVVAMPSRRGRRPSHEFSESESNALRALRLIKGSLPLAVESFLAHEACRSETSEYLASILERAAAQGRAPSWPPCVRRAAHLSSEMEAQFRGERAVGKFAPTISRGAFWIDENGNQVELRPHDIWESDDMSSNEPFRRVDPSTGEVKIGRQILLTSDRQSAAMLGLTLIGRDRDAYRAEDILDHLLDLIDNYGMPRLWRIERGVWESRAIDGVALDDARAQQLGYLGDRWEGRRIGGLSDLFHVSHQFSSNGKGGIEGAFNHLQDLTAHQSLHIGRERGEFEFAARELRRAQSGMADAQARFWEASECADAFSAAISQFNSQPKERSMYGGARLVPNDLLRDYKLPKRELPASERWRFHPHKRLAVVQRGLLTATVDGKKFTWEAAGEGIALEHGHRVAIAFHPHHPERGCTVVEAEFGPRNRHGRPIGEPLFVAEPLEQRAQWDERAIEDRGGSLAHPAQRWRGQVRREFRAIAGATKSHLADGRGRAATVESGFGPERHASAEETARSERASTPRRNSPSPASGRSIAPAAEDLAALEDEALKYL